MFEQNTLIGFACLCPVKGYNIAFITNVIIKPDKRKQGYATKLLEHIIHYGWHQLKFKQIHISCYKNNQPALSLYKKIGFKSYKEQARLDRNLQDTSLIHLSIEQ